MATKNKKSVFETPVLSTKIKTASVKLFPEAALGYLVGPILALLANAVVNTYLTQYWINILNLKEWAYLFMTLLPLISTIIIIIGNLLVGRLMERKPSIAGKARPLILLGLPFIAIALFVLFNTPYPEGATIDNPSWPTLIMVTIGYNLYYAVAYPFYYTSHSALVSLSTRNGAGRSLLATASNGAQVAASGAAGMVGPFIINALGLLPQTDAATGKPLPFNPVEAKDKWSILIIILIACLVVGCLLEYYFTRERITEENVKLAHKETNEEAEESAKKIPVSQQIKICLHDKYWWFIIIFFFLYQLGGMLKNNDLSFFSQAFIGDLSLQGTINIVGAIPTALGMVFIWPLANKYGKAACIKVGAIIAALTGLLGFVCIPLATDTVAVSAMAIASFCLKAIGTVPAMYISMALMADVLDRQEAVYGKRTDGFTMSVYGSIMVGMTGIANAIIVGLDGAVAGEMMSEAKQVLHTTIFFGGEVVCYLIIAIMFLFMNVEKFIGLSQSQILKDQRKYAEEHGIEFVEPHERMLIEQKESEEQILKETLEQLKKTCAKKELDYETELAKFNKTQKDKRIAAETKKAENEKKVAEKKATKEAEQKAKYEALTAEQKETYNKKLALKAEKKEAEENKLAQIFEADRLKYYGKF